MELLEFPSDMRNEIKELAKIYSITIEEARNYYLMGGFEHAKQLLQLRQKLLSSASVGVILNEEALENVIRSHSNQIWDQRNKEVRCAMEELT
ncbi:hypothetical protein GCM10010912_17780 [Paenibacillus albidus]|uniref:Uncharacterized protein n=1 Tax=Paenibacillus albidus TaxID=2041023 RepID=A0A917FDG4_9BACL|nr:hypothetical protein [Paenibacillus albidus]GGF73007.1 hypothetical protein GCM10010912_17780 [Paenibacillus albidus]